MKRKLFISLALPILGLALLWTRPLVNNANAEQPAGSFVTPAVAQKNGDKSGGPSTRKDRCATKNIDETVAAQYDAALTKFNSQRNPGQIRKSGSVTIGVFFQKHLTKPVDWRQLIEPIAVFARKG